MISFLTKLPMPPKKIYRLKIASENIIADLSHLVHLLKRSFSPNHLSRIEHLHCLLSSDRRLIKAIGFRPLDLGAGPLVKECMVGRAQNTQIIDGIGTSLGDVLDVMNMEKARGSASRAVGCPHKCSGFHRAVSPDAGWRRECSGRNLWQRSWASSFLRKSNAGLSLSGHVFPAWS